MLLRVGYVGLSEGPKVQRTRPAAAPLFMSAAVAYGTTVTGIVLSGGDGDGAAGLRIIKEHGGAAFVQHPDEAEKPSMAYAAMRQDHPDACLPAAEIGERLRECAPRLIDDRG